MVVLRDIVYGRIPGTVEESYCLDLYLPNDVNLKLDESNYESLVYSSAVAESARLENDGCLTRKRSKKQEATLDSRSISDISAPLVLFFHGGGWRRGGKNAWRHYLYHDVNFLVALNQYFTGTYANVGTTLLKNGIMCALVSYPLTEVVMPVLLCEMMASYFQCVFVTSVLSLPILVTYFSLRSTVGSHGDWNCISPEWSDTNYLKIYLLSVLLCVNVLTLYILTSRQTRHLKAALVTLSVVCLACALFIQEQSCSPETRLLLATVLTFVCSQTIIAHNRLKRRIHNSFHQSTAVAMAVKWATHVCHKTHSRLYLMGHSAGGHLVTRTVLDDTILQAFECKAKDISGVISISGVYDLLCLQKRLLRTVYLLPTFGKDHDGWMNASPTHIVQKQRRALADTRFLLLSAMKDPFLKDQSLEFYSALRSRGYACTHIEIPWTNHFSIITGYNTEKGSTLRLCFEFVLA